MLYIVVTQSLCLWGFYFKSIDLVGLFRVFCAFLYLWGF